MIQMLLSAEILVGVLYISARDGRRRPSRPALFSPNRQAVRLDGREKVFTSSNATTPLNSSPLREKVDWHLEFRLRLPHKIITPAQTFRQNQSEGMFVSEATEIILVKLSTLVMVVTAWGQYANTEHP